MPRFPAALSLCHPKSNSDRLVKSYSLYSHLASHLDKIHSLNYDQLQHTSQIILQCVYNNWWALPRAGLGPVRAVRLHWASGIRGPLELVGLTSINKAQLITSYR
jgi:hypothetical protein